MTPPTVGIGIRSASVCAVLVDRGSISWHARVELASGDDIGAALAQVLRSLPRSRSHKWFNVVVAVGPAHAQTRRLAALPDTADADVLTKAVAQNASRFFLLPSHAVRASTVVPVERGQAWAALFDEDVLGAIARALTGHGLAIEAIIPTAFALSAAAESGSLAWRDGDMTLRLDVRDRALSAMALHHANGAGGADEQPSWQPALQALADDAADFADAYGAAVAHRPSVPRALGIGSASDLTSKTANRRGMRLPIATVLVSALFGVLAPGVTAAVFERIAIARLRAAPAMRADVASLDRAIAAHEAALARVATFARTRTSRTLTLTALAAILPDSCAVSSLQIDSSFVEISVISPRTGDVLAALEGDARVAAMSLVGPIVRKTGSDQRLERATIRFRLRAISRTAPLVARSGDAQPEVP